MNYLKKYGSLGLTVFLVLTLFFSFSIFEVKAQPSSEGWTGRYVYDVLENRSHHATFHLGPQVFFNGSDYVELFFEDRYASDGYYLIENSHITARIYDWYTVFFDPDDNYICVDDERWIVELYGKNKKWREVDLYGPSLTYANNDTHLTVTRSFDSVEGQFNVTYIVSRGSLLKHDVAFMSKFEDETTFRVIMRLTGIHHDKVTYAGGNFTVTEETHVLTPYFQVGENSSSLIYRERLYALGTFNETSRTWVNDKLLDVVFDVHGSGSKTDIVIGNYTLNLNGTFIIDPASSTWYTDPAGNDADQDDDGTGTWDESGNTLEVRDYIFPASDRQWGGLKFDDVGDSITQGTEISTAYFRVDVDSPSADDPSFDIHAQDADNPADLGQFQTDLNNVGRPRTSANTEWSVTGLGAGWENSPSIVDVIQEVVDLGDWGAGDDILLILKPTGGDIKNFRFDTSETANDPELYIEWVAGVEYDRPAAQSIGVGFATSRVLTALKDATQAIGVALSASRWIHILTGVTLAVSTAFVATRVLTAKKAAAQAVGVGFVSSRVLTALKDAAQSVGIAFSASRYIQIFTAVTLAVAVALQSSRAATIYKDVTLAVAVAFSAAGVLLYLRDATLAVSNAFQTSWIVTRIRAATQSIGVAFQSSRILTALKDAAQAISVAFTGVGVPVAIEYARDATLAVAAAFQSSRVATWLKQATQSINVAFQSSRAVSIYKDVTLAVANAFQTSRILTAYRDVTLAVSNAFQTSWIVTRIRAAAQSISVGFATSRTISVLKDATLSLTVAFQSSRVLTALKAATLAVAVAFSAVGVLKYYRDVTLAVAAAFQSSRILTALRAAAQAIGVGFVVTVPEVLEYATKGFVLATVFISLFVGFPIVGVLLLRRRR